VSLHTQSCPTLTIHTAPSKQILVGYSRRLFLRLIAALIVIAAFILSWFTPGDSLIRCFAGLGAAGCLLLVTEITADPKNRALRGEQLRIRRNRQSIALSFRTVCKILLCTLIAAAGIALLAQARQHTGAFAFLLRYAGGVVFVYGAAETAVLTVSLCFLIAGFSGPPILRTPIAATSVADFWARRWNVIVHEWLRQFIFRPFARRGRPSLGILCAFFVSGVLHGWIALIALDWFAATTMTAFFLIQGPLVLLEHKLRIHTWPTEWARAWTLTAILATSPLLLEPVLRLFNL
jgi:hypothetical protein